jgi:AAA+ ATPase superfamily predicted ATPase
MRIKLRLKCGIKIIIFMVPQFVDRERELKFLEDKYREKGAQLIIIYGRRRVGKTELVKQFIKNKEAIYHLSTSDGITNNVNKLKEEFSNFLRKPYFRSLNVNIDDLLIYFGDEIGKRRVILVIDEFQYLIESDKSVISLFQRAWDEKLKDTGIFLILTGSSIGMMENEVLSKKSPLYGRRTGSWKVEELSFPNLFKFFPKKDIEELIKIWSITGGIPFYIIQLDPSKSVEENVREKIMRKGNILYDEPLFLLREEFREQRVYLSILRAISNGYSTLSQISQVTGIDRSNLTSYLERLEENGIIERVIPYGKKKGWYAIKDNFFDFWFKFIYNNLNYLEIDMVDEVMQRIDLNQYFSFKFEKLIRELIKSKLLKLPFEYNLVTLYSHKGEEVDVVAEGKDTIFLGEVKWEENVDPRPLLSKMRRIMNKIAAENKKEYYGVFAKSFKGCDLPELLCYDLIKIREEIVRSSGN